MSETVAEEKPDINPAPEASEPVEKAPELSVEASKEETVKNEEVVEKKIEEVQEPSEEEGKIAEDPEGEKAPEKAPDSVSEKVPEVAPGVTQEVALEGEKEEKTDTEKIPEVEKEEEPKVEQTEQKPQQSTDENLKKMVGSVPGSVPTIDTTPPTVETKRPPVEKGKIVDFITLFNSNKFKNVTLIFGKSIKIRCHRAVLSQSPHLVEKMSNTKENELYIQDDMQFRVEDIKFITQWFYGKKPDPTNVDWDNLIRLAKRFKMNHLLHYIYEISDRVPSEDDRKYFLSNIVVPMKAGENVDHHVSTTLFNETEKKMGERKKSSVPAQEEDFTTTNFLMKSSSSREFPVHKEVMVVRSLYFQEMLKEDPTKDSIRVHASETVIRMFLNWVYLKEVKGEHSIIDFVEAFNLGCKLEDGSFQKLCLEKVREMLNPKNAIKFFLNSHRVIRGNPELMQMLMNVLMQMFKEEEHAKSFVDSFIAEEKSLFEEIDSFLLFAKKHKEKKENLLNKLGEKKAGLMLKKEILVQKIDSFQEKIMQAQEENAKIQYSIAKAPNPKKMRSKAAKLMEEDKKNEEEAKKLEERASELEKKEQENRAKLKENENQVLELFVKKDSEEDVLSRIEREIKAIESDLSELNSVKIEIVNE